MARVGLGRLEYLMERMDRNIDLEGSDIIVNTLTSDLGVTVTAGGLLVTAGGLVVTAGNVGVPAGSLEVTAGNLVVTAGTTFLKGTIPLVRRQGSPATTDDGTTAISAANMAAGVIVCTPTAARSKAVDTGPNIISSLGLGAQFDSADFTIVNLSTTDAHIITLTEAGGTEITGSNECYPRDDTALSHHAGVATFRATRKYAHTGSVALYRIA